jgi:putative peptide zinc metalloprotease protein
VSSQRITRGIGAFVDRSEKASEQPTPRVPSTAADARPALRGDLVIRRQVQMGEVKWVVKDPVANAYYNFDNTQWSVIELFDGTRTVAEIHDAYQARFPKEIIEKALILDFEEFLRELDFLQKSAAERSQAVLARLKGARQRAAEEKAEGFNPFFLLFHVLDPDRFLGRTLKYVRWLWKPSVIAFACCLFAWTIGIIGLHWDEIWGGTKVMYALASKPFLDLIQFIIILTAIGAIHEFAHGYVCKMYGGEVHDIGIALVYFTPAFYCNTTDSLLFENKWHGLWVTTAGIYIEAWICSIATIFWVASYPDTVLHQFAFNAMLFTGVSTVFFNINPLIKIDGYYALTSLVEISELREESLRYIGLWLQRNVLHLPVDVPAVSRRKRRVYWIYGTLALAWLVVVMRFIGGLIYNLYAKYVPNFAVVLLLLTMYRLFRKRVRLATRTARLFYLDKKELLMSPRMRRILIASAAALILLLCFPWTRRTLRSEAVLRPLTTVRLEAPEDAVVDQVLVREGDHVEAGQPIFRLSSPEAVELVTRLEAERQHLKQEASRARQAAEATGVYVSEQRQVSVQAALSSGVEREERLLVRSSIAGRVLTPYIEDLKGQAVPAGSLLAEVGDIRRMRAELGVSERLLDDLQKGATVSALLPGRFGMLHGTIMSISPATLAQPQTATAERDPAAPTLRPDQFVAVAVFENPGGQLLPGMEAKAKIYGRRASALSRVVRLLKRWSQSVFW